MGYQVLFIVNPHGTLIYDRVFSSSIEFSSNDTIRLSSTFHSMHLIAGQIAPRGVGTGTSDLVEESKTSKKDKEKEKGKSAGGKSFLDLGNTGILKMESTLFKLQSFNSYTGVMFLLVADPFHSDADLESSLKTLYLIYSDYVNKNPFQQSDMPIRSLLFDEQIDKLFEGKK